MLSQRIKSSIAMVLIFSLTYFFLDSIFFEFLVLLLGGFLLFELSNILKLNSVNKIFYWILAATPIITQFLLSLSFSFSFFNSFLGSYESFLRHQIFEPYILILIPFSLVFWFLIVPFDLIYKKISSNAVIKIFYGAVYISPMLLTIMFIFWADKNFLFMIILMIWLADIGAYFFGKKFGKFKIAKNISPGKTLEGLLGGFISNIAFVLLWATNTNINLLDGFLLAFLVTALSLYGDIYESFLKRMAKIKDSSSMIPGHGGFLDRMDSFCPTIPILFILFELFRYI
ncbi:MAG: hypothetical protein CMH24_03795 [Nitrosomonadales bacterium]|nr:hypothetical protein [Nitrosomonadales bacterium]|tara:strand:+ start:312 stop:1169 length:858 start_codon:yes stop_codon:yes gene_type:complete